MPADSELLRLYADTRSEAAFTQLVQRHLNTVYAAAFRRLGGDAHHAADVAQIVFTSLARHASSLAHRPVLTGWLHTATRHAAIDLIRREQRRNAREQQASALADVNTPDRPSTDWDQLRPILDTAIDQLGEHDRELVLLRFFENRSFANIGAQLALTEDAARMRANRALEKLRSLLARRGVNSTAAALTLILTTQPLIAAPVGLVATITSGSLVAATSASALAASSFLLMSTTKTFLISAGLVTAFALGTAVYESQRAASTAVELTQLQQTENTLRAANASLAAEITATNTKIIALQTEQKEAATKLVQPASPSTLPVTPAIKSLWRYPGYGRLYVEKQRATLTFHYGQLYRDLHLTPDQISKFENTQTELQQSIVDIWTEAEARGLPASDTSVARMTTEPHRLLETDLRALLGTTGYEQYQNYEKTKGARELTTSLAASLYASEAPLTATQGTELAKIIAANTETKKTPMQDDGQMTMYRLSDETNWATVATQAQGLLSATQITTLKKLIEQQRIDGELSSIFNSSVN